MFGVPIYLSDHIPLRVTRHLDNDDYVYIEVEKDLLCVRQGTAIYVHPDRWELFKEMFE